MNTSLYQFSQNNWLAHPSNQLLDNSKAQLVLCFASKEVLEQDGIFNKVKLQFPNAAITMCSTAGEIYHDQVQDNTFVAAALQFDNTKIETASININDFSNSYDAAVNLANKLSKKDLTYIMVFSDGALVNGSELVKGLSEVAGNNVLVTGGLAGDAANFKSTLVGLNEQPVTGKIVVIGFYGQHLKLTHGSQGGWDIFGLEKRITKSQNNVLFEIEDQNALELYKKYLGEEAKNLPGSALLFPLSVIIPGATKPVVRTILSINEDEKSMTFAGDVPEGSKVRFMKANFDKITHAASTAAQQTLLSHDGKPSFALLISCVGRKLILGSKTKEEVEAVDNAFGKKTLLAGFYSYGEISPFNEENNCQLHNQTMTITSFYES